MKTTREKLGIRSATTTPGRKRDRRAMVGYMRSKLEEQGGFSLAEALVSSMILGFGLLAVAGMSMSTARQGRLAELRTDQALAAQLLLAEIHQEIRLQGFSSVSSTERSVSVGERIVLVTTTVSLVSSRVKEVRIEVSPVGSVGSRTFTTRVYAPRQLPGPVN